VQLRRAHGALEAEQQTVVEVARVVDAILIEDQGVTEGGDLQKPMPVRGTPGETRDLQPQHDPGPAQPHLGDELLEPGSVRC
jgi:hypothetical protein